MSQRKLSKRQQKPNTTNTGPGERLEIDFSITYLKLMFCYSLFFNNPSRGLLKNFSKILSVLSPSVYINDANKALVIENLIALLNIRNSGISHIEIITEKLIDSKSPEEQQSILELIDEVEAHDMGRMTEANIDECAKYVEDRLRFSAIFRHRQALEDNLSEIRTGSYESFDSVASSFEMTCKELSLDIKRAMHERDYDNADFSLSDSSDMIRQVHNHFNKSSNIINTGIQCHNRQLNGGYQAGRVYLYLAISGGGKSMMLLNTVKWFLKHNTHIKSENPALKPVALYITQENDMNETVERMFNLCVPSDKRDNREFKDIDPSEIEKLWKQYGYTGEDQDIVLRYRPNKSIDTADVDGMITELAEEGKEVKLLIHDYIKRVNPVNYANDIRLDLGEVINEFSVIAKQRKIPVITASQLNREALRKIVESSKKSANVAEKISGADVGESALIIENCDYAFIIHNEETISGKKFLTFNRIKSRGKITYLRNFIAQPYDATDSLIDDFNCTTPLSSFDLSDSLNSFNVNGGAAPGQQPTTLAGSRRKTPLSVDDPADSDSQF